MLLDAGADPNEKDALAYAVRKGDPRLVQRVLDAGSIVNPNEAGTSPLCQAASGNHFEIVKMLVEAGVDLSIKERTNQTALDIGKDEGFENIVNFLTKVAST